ncbi:MAG TPA: hypothetical protein VHV32_01195 [Candidatus Angelobacter sp.]|nr:hypothetical protein [Candidatus Angelobacter sp.]
MSSITALELLAAVDAAPAAGFLDVKQRISAAYSMCNGRILEDPRMLLCKEILRIPFPADQMAPASRVIERQMDVVRRGNSLEQLLKGIPFKGRHIKMNRTSAITQVMAGPKRDWKAAVEKMADEYYPAWREHFKDTGKRVPPEKKRELKPRSTWQPQRAEFIKSLIQWLHADETPALLSDLCKRFDAVLEFTIFISREFLIGNYSLEGHDSDVFDMYQLQYLAMDRFVIVTSDPDLVHRTQHSCQASRILSFDQFFSTL